jgi:hypothetical protein
LFLAAAPKMYGNMQLYKVKAFQQDDENICIIEEWIIESLEKTAKW